MSGHSKWHNIKIKKSKMDNIRGAVFTKISKEIHMAVREGGPDPDNNYRLKMAVQKAKDNNMPSDNIKKTIEKAVGGSAADFEEIIYEGYGPAGVAVMLQAATDNRNRTAAEVRRLFTRNGGSLGESGCVSWMFEKKGLIFVPENTIDEEALLSIVIDAGADDLNSVDEGFEITMEPTSMTEVRKALEEKKVAYESAEITWIPKNNVKVSDEDAGKVLKLVEELEEYDDIQQVYANFDISKEFMEKME
jgi:YebC/PmpR family DNA-binding regulatory protein